MSRAYLTRIKRLETERHRLTDPASMTDEELLVVAFGYDTPAFRRAREAFVSGNDQTFDRLLLAAVNGDLSTLTH